MKVVCVNNGPMDGAMESSVNLTIGKVYEALGDMVSPNDSVFNITNDIKGIIENTQVDIKSYGVEKDNSNLTVDNLTIFFEGSTENDITILYIFNEQKYFDLFNENPPLQFLGNQYDILNSSSKPLN